MNPEIEPAPDDEPTERFARQACPHCDGITAVALCFPTARCEACGERFEVAPPLRRGGERTGSLPKIVIRAKQCHFIVQEGGA